MLNDNKSIYMKEADLIPNWRQMTRKQLLDGYIDNKNSNPRLASSYMGAIMCTYWNAIDKYFTHCKTAFDKEDYHDWLTHAILYATDHAAWRDTSKAISKKQDGANTCVNQCIASTQAINYQSSNYEMRKDRVNNASLDALIEENGDKFTGTGFEVYDKLEESDFIVWAKLVIKESFEKKHYVKAFMLDNICNGSSFVRKPGKMIKAEYPEGISTKYLPKYHRGLPTSAFSKNQLITNLKSLDKSYCNMFANSYNIDPKLTIEAANVVLSLSNDETNVLKFKKVVKDEFTDIKKEFLDYLKDPQKSITRKSATLYSIDTRLKMCC